MDFKEIEYILENNWFCSAAEVELAKELIETKILEMKSRLNFKIKLHATNEGITCQDLVERLK